MLNRFVGDGGLAVSPSGEVWPCVFSRWKPLGNLLDRSFPELIEMQVLASARKQLKEYFISMGSDEDDKDDDKESCGPTYGRCEPQCPPRCSPACNPCAPSRRCWPSY
ncbi:SPASM domain-containing protein [Laceyella tengchongensis]|uniref:SPASM domain-containing protein n=1 Tax=Laceyella TaxID=292635 RepID=UPI003A52221B